MPQRVPGPVHPPGLYGDDESFRALNLIGKDSVHAALALPDTIPSAIYPVDDPRSLLPWLLTAAMVLLLTDGIIMLFRSGRGLRIPSFSRDAGALVALIAVFALTLPPAAFAQSKADTDFALQATTDTRLAFVVTGDAEIDSISEAGLAGLSQTLLRRTALEPGPPLGIDLETSELAFFPIIYWPIDPQAPVPSAKVLARLDAYMKNGGTVLIDTRDEIQSVPGADGATTGPGMQRLRVILRGTDIPELETVPADHVLTKTFYLLQNFPGRWDGSPLWVEASIRDPDAAPRPARNADGGFFHHYYRQRSCRRLGGGRNGRATAAGCSRRRVAARAGVPGRREHRHVFHDRQLQGRPGAHPGTAGKAWTVT